MNDIAPFVQRRRELRQGLQPVGSIATVADGHSHGCEHCSGGLLGDLRTDGPGPLYLLRYYQAREETITFCTCQSGKNFRSFLLQCHAKIKDGRDVVPDSMRNAIMAWVHPTPTVHFDE